MKEYLEDTSIHGLKYINPDRGLVYKQSIYNIQGVPHHISILALNYDFRDSSESLSKMNHLKKLYEAIVKYFLQKILGFSSIMCVFLSLKR